MTNFFVKLYWFLRGHRALMWGSMVFLFIAFGYCATRIHLEEDLNKLMPSSKNEDGTTKMAFADLRIKDLTYVLFEGLNGAGTEEIAGVCDEFVDSLMSWNNAEDSLHQEVGDVFYRMPEDIMYDAIDFLSANLPAYIDTSAYAGFDTLLTREHVAEQMKQNAEDLDGEFGSMFPELIQMDPVGMRNVLKEQMAALLPSGGSEGGFRTIHDHFFVPDSTVCVAFMTPMYSANNTGMGSALFVRMNGMIEDFAVRHPDVRIVYHGTPASGYYNSSVIKNDLTTTVTWSMVLVLIVLFICMRNWNTIPMLILPVAFGALFGLSVMYFLKGEFSLIALGIGSVVLGVAMSYVLHIITHYKYVGDAEVVLRDEVKPVLLGCITTIGSFMGLFFVNTDLLKDFGIFAALSIVGTTVFSLVYLPHLLPLEANKRNKAAFRLIDAVNNYPFHKKKPLLWAIGAVTAVTIGFYLVKGTEFDSDMGNLGYKAENTEYSWNLLREKTITGDKSEYFASQGKTMEEAIENFSVLDAKLDSLQRLGLVKSYTHTNKLFVPLRVQQERIDAWKAYWTEERQAKVRRLIAETAPGAGLVPEAFETFFEKVNEEYEPVALYEQEFVPKGYLSTLMEKTYAGDYLCFTDVRYPMVDPADKNNAYNRICGAIADEPNMLVLDTYYYTTDSLEKLNSDFNVLQWVSMMFVFVVLLFSFHFNVKNTLLGFAPILLSWLIVLGAMAIFDIQFNLINIIISTFIFGIGVDYSIFVMNGLIDEKASTLAYHKTAIFFSAFILVVTVASMLFADHPAIKSVGFATLVGMVSAVVLSYVVQPAVYRAPQPPKGESLAG